MQVWIFYGALKLSIGAIWAPFRNQDSAERDVAVSQRTLLGHCCMSFLNLCCVLLGTYVAWHAHASVLANAWHLHGIRGVLLAFAPFGPKRPLILCGESYMQLGIRLPHVSLI